jgi:predicted ferric reductase
MTPILLAFFLVITGLAWARDVLVNLPPAEVHTLWLLRQEGLYLSGLWSIVLMSLAMFLASRPSWLETPLGGMDRVYRSHKWAGILAGVMALAHWLIELSDDLIKSAIGRADRLPKEQLDGFWQGLRSVADDLGEWAIYLLLAMLVIALWKRFPYRPWRLLHRAMPLIYLMLAYHAVLLAPLDYWQQPVGWLLAFSVSFGVYGALRSLFGNIGRLRQVAGEIVGLEQPAPDITTVRCRLGSEWRGHRAGQFAFVTFDEEEGAHPFTIASADQGDATLTFHIKALGDYTRDLASRLRVGQSVFIEGPYGRFESTRIDRRARQIWVAGGIGVTPFLAWLESMQAAPGQAPAAEIHYSTRQAASDPFVARLEKLCAGLPGLTLHIHDAGQGQLLDTDALIQGLTSSGQRSEIWFCGPGGFAQSLKNGLKKALTVSARFHQEAFEMR